MVDRLVLIALGLENHQVIAGPEGFVIAQHVNWENRLSRNCFPKGIANVYGNMNVSRNGLKSLEHAPRIITGIFDCSFNELVTFKGGPYYVEKLMAIGNKELCSLDYAPILGKGLLGDLRTTKIHPEHIAFYIWANQMGVWDPMKTVGENVYFSCLHVPSIFQNQWDLLHGYRTEKETRGRAVGNDLGII